MTDTYNRASHIPKEKIVMPKQYPIHVSDTIGVNAYYQKLHWHDVLEINLIKFGTGYYMINGQRFDFQQGDILLINSNDLHCAYEKQDLIMQVISFDISWLVTYLRCDPEILSPFKEMGIHFANLLDRSNPQLPYLRTLLLELQQEHENELQSYTSVVFSYLLRFLACVNRDFRIQGSASSQQIMNSAQLEKMRLVIDAMEHNYAHPWTLKRLASLVYLSPSRFSDIFRKVVGSPPLLYLIRIRLEHAAVMLETTDMKVTEVAMECGFRSLSNFNRLFRQHIGVNPTVARKQNSEITVR